LSEGYELKDSGVPEAVFGKAFAPSMAVPDAAQHAMLGC
jgi:hypothetical protein